MCDKCEDNKDDREEFIRRMQEVINSSLDEYNREHPNEEMRMAMGSGIPFEGSKEDFIKHMMKEGNPLEGLNIPEELTSILNKVGKVMTMCKFKDCMEQSQETYFCTTRHRIFDYLNSFGESALRQLVKDWKVGNTRARTIH